MKKLLPLLLLLTGCAPPLLAPPPPVPLSRRAQVEFRWDVKTRERRALLAGLDLAERAFLEIEGELPAVRRVVLWPRSVLPRAVTKGLPARDRYTGVCRRGLFGATIQVATGRRSPMEAIPHELRHALIGDGDHERAGWRRIDRIGRQLSLLP